MKAKEKATPGEEAAGKILAVWGRGTSPAELNDAAFRLGLLVSAGLLKHSRVIHMLNLHMEFRNYDSDQISMSRDAVQRGIATPATAAQIFADNDNAPRQTGFTASELQYMTFKPIKHVVPGYLTEGCTLFAGRPKIGKSWLALDIGLTVSRGTTCLGVECEQGDVLYLALEDHPERLASRIRQLMPFIPGASEPWPANLHLHTEWPRADAGGLDKIETWLDEHPAARVVVIDVLAMFRPPTTTNKAAYEQDYAAIKSLQSIGSRRHVLVLVVTHTRKAASESGDPFETISGTLGLSGAADAALILNRDGQGTKLYARGRDFEPIESAVSFDKLSCRWRVLGDASEVRRSDERASILSVLIDATEPMTPDQLAAATGKSRNTVNQLLFKMCKDGEVEKLGRGKYIHPSRKADLTTPHKFDKKVRKKKKVEGKSHAA